MEPLKCKCGEGKGAFEAVSRSGTPGIGLDHIVVECGKCHTRIELFDAQAVAADKAIKTQVKP